MFTNQLPLVTCMHQAVLPQALPVTARDETFQHYQTPVGHSWPEDQYARGSYSYVGAGQHETYTAQHVVAGESVRTIFAPEGNIYFAGEHATVLLDVLGTMEAAVESGERIARLMIKSFNACR